MKPVAAPKTLVRLSSSQSTAEAYREWGLAAAARAAASPLPGVREKHELAAAAWAELAALEERVVSRRRRLQHLPDTQPSPACHSIKEMHRAPIRPAGRIGDPAHGDRAAGDWGASVEDPRARG